MRINRPWWRCNRSYCRHVWRGFYARCPECYSYDVEELVDHYENVD